MLTLEDVNNDAPILKKTVDLYKEFYGYLKLFPKKDQYLLGKRCEDAILEFMQLILLAVSLPKEEKRQTLVTANGKFDQLKVLLRVARELKMIDTKKYLSLQEKIQEIGRMLGGWLRSLA